MNSTAINQDGDKYFTLTVGNEMPVTENKKFRVMDMVRFNGVPVARIGIYLRNDATSWVLDDQALIERHGDARRMKVKNVIAAVAVEVREREYD